MSKIERKSFRLSAITTAISALTLLPSAVPALAAGRGSTELDVDRATTYRRPPTTFGVFLGIDGGYSHLGIGDGLKELDKNGYQLGFKALGSYYFKRDWVVDLGGGWAYHRVDGDESGYSEGNRMRVGFIELSPRALLTDEWQLGPYVDATFGADPTFSQPYLPNRKSSMGVFAGAQLLYEFQNTRLPIRFGGRVGTDLNIEDRQLVMAQLSFQIGFPLGGNRTPDDDHYATSSANAHDSRWSDVDSTTTTASSSQLVSDREYIAENAPAAPLAAATSADDDARLREIPADGESAEAEASGVLPSDPSYQRSTLVDVKDDIEVQTDRQAKTVIVRMRETPLSKETTHFKTGSAALTPKARKFLIRLGAFLKANPTLWKNMNVDGHTDVRGSLAFNMRLSRARAASVVAALIQGGGPSHRMIARGYGPKRPLDRRNNEAAWAKNRRVEIKFNGVTDTVKFGTGVSKVKLKSGSEFAVR